ncbi:fluoroquinolone transport system permease protein [Paenibacillus phyllosphaerae]|uniref:Fluoroquinolone transport system permease protein n=1 Tax=Paenibacillus phyllosphaerae TaxID=274593 RepID=A0A7W5B5G0_9BACL|nr:hypothetical protein [Paenibacillus phyllosphaerae]MBB3114742.1 fluoroquinolone transport system permease protein [Paenibacillus phyllosphaerae]
MNKYRALLVTDTRQIMTDPMLMASLFGPLLLLAIARFFFPLLSDWFERQYQFVLTEYTDFFAAFLLLFIPLLPGSMVGLLMLDERDENMIAYYAVTPLSRVGYFRYRLFLPCLLTLLLSSAFILYSGITHLQIESLYIVALLVLEAPMIALFLVSFASNKVEGLAMTKASGLLFAGPIVAFFVPEPWTYAGAWIPTFWTTQSYLAGIAENSWHAFGWFIGGGIFQTAIIGRLLRSYLKRSD